MPFEAPNYVTSLGFPTTVGNVQRGPLTAFEAQILSDKLANDSQKCIYSSLLSISNAIKGIEQEYSTWPTIKLYYSCFYAIRALLALNGICLFYLRKKDYWIESITGAIPRRPPTKVRGSTHKFAFMLYENLFSNSPLLSQPIDNVSPFEWLMLRREEANYRIGRFVEPGASPWLRFLKANGVRRLCVEYLTNTDLYAFDPDHAILSYPIYVLKYIQLNGVRGHSCLADSKENIDYEAYFNDQYGPLKPLINLKRTLVVM